MNRKLRLYSVLVIACMCSFMSYLYVHTQTTTKDTPYEFTMILEKSIQEKTYLPEVRFVEKIIKTIFDIAQFK